MQVNGISSYTAASVATDLTTSKAKEDSFQNALDDAVKNKDKTELRKSCVQFESYFIHMMFKEMRKTVHSENGILPKSKAEEMFEDMLDEEYSNNLAKNGGIGLADMMYKQMSREMDGQ